MDSGASAFRGAEDDQTYEGGDMVDTAVVELAEMDEVRSASGCSCRTLLSLLAAGLHTSCM